MEISRSGKIGLGSAAAIVLIGLVLTSNRGDAPVAAPTTTVVSTTTSSPTTTTTTAPTTTTTAPTTTTTAAPTTTTTAAPTTTTTAAPTTTASPTTTTSTPGLPPRVPYSAYELITDDSGTLEVAVPVEWNDREGIAWDFRGNGVLVGPAIGAAPDREAWLAGWSTPGVFIGASAELGMTVEQMLDSLTFNSDCRFQGRVDYDDGEYRGKLDAWVQCGDAASEFWVVAAEPYGGGALVLVEVILVTDADREALERVLNSFRYRG